MAAIARQTIEQSGDLPEGVNLWSLSPKLSTKRFRSSESFDAYTNTLAEMSAKDANLVVWIQARKFANNNFWYPSFGQWIRHGVIISGSGERTHIGVVFSTSIENSWGDRVIWSPESGPKSSQACKWVLNRAFGKGGGLVCDPFARDHNLAVWCRRLNIAYCGYAIDKDAYDHITRELAQEDIPGIQEELPLLNNGE